MFYALVRHQDAAEAADYRGGLLEENAVSTTYAYCVEGLECLPAPLQPMASSCTRDCRDTACPAGSACIDDQLDVPSWSDPVHTYQCAPTCVTDRDCQKGLRAGTCVADPQSEARVCRPIVGCASGCPGDHYCVSVPPECIDTSWCKRR